MDELESSVEGDRTQHEEEDVTSKQCVSKELDRLQHSGHFGTFAIVEQGVQEYKHSSRTVNKRNQLITTILDSRSDIWL